MTIINKNSLFPFVEPHLSSHPVIVEAGAFDGKDTIRMKNFWPGATIHAFEPVPEIFNLLVHNTRTLSDVHCYPYALSDATGSASFYVSESPDFPGKPFQAGSLLPPKERLALSPVTYPRTITVDTITGDDWAQKFSISHVDFLWLDMQGYELNALKAAPQLVATVKALYTEVEFIEAYKGQYLYNDVKNWLEKNGFRIIAQDFPEQPKWFFGNLLFIRKQT